MTSKYVACTCWFYFVLYLGSCDTKSAYPPTPCDSLVPEYCSYPWPNDYWLLKDTDGNPDHLVLSEENLPISVDGKTIDPTAWNILDGFSPIPAILAFWKDLNIDNCARLWNISQSNDIDSPTIILNAKYNTRISHWVELDHSSDSVIGAEANRSLMIWPAQRLNDSQLYIVALRNLYDNDGNLVTPSPGFKALRDNIPSNDSSIESRREYYNNFIFPVLQANGIERASLQLCWYFTTMSQAYLVERMLVMRDDAFSRINWENGGVEYRISEMIENPWSNIARKVRGQMSVPWYLNSRLPGMDVRIVSEWDDPLNPVYQRNEFVEFELLIPNSVANMSKESRFVQYGHGLFGSMTEIEFGIFRETANEYGYILAASNWIGLSWEDVPFVIEMIALNFTDFPMVPDRCHQGMLNALFLMKLILSDNFQNDACFVFNGSNTIKKPVNRHYYGNSQGGILGSVYMALTTDVDKGVLGEPGGPYALLLPRSVDFTALFDICKVRYKNDVDRIFLFEMIGLLWNSLESSGYINHINMNNDTGTYNTLLPSTPSHNILIHYSLGDAQVTWLGAQIIARTLGCYMYRSQKPEYNETLYGYNWIEDDNYIINVSDPKYENGACLIMGWNYDVPQVPFVNLPPNSNYDTHDSTSHQADAQLANYRFFADDILYNPCNGTCNGKR